VAIGKQNGGTAAYVLELRRLIHEDAYNTVHAADEIARRMLRTTVPTLLVFIVIWNAAWRD
jgi:hypothetical protein